MQYRTVILSPELTYDQQFMVLWTDVKFRKQISHIIVDEAHCVSTWGRSFQSAYLKLRMLQYILQDEVQWYLTSATLSPEVLVTTGSPGDGKALRGRQTWAQPLGWPLSHWVCWVVSEMVQGYHS